MSDDINIENARKLALVSQGLHKQSSFGCGTKGVLNTLQQLSYVQIDTIFVIERAHHHCLWNRAPNYTPDMLNQ